MCARVVCVLACVCVWGGGGGGGARLVALETSKWACLIPVGSVSCFPSILGVWEGKLKVQTETRHYSGVHVGERRLKGFVCAAEQLGLFTTQLQLKRKKNELFFLCCNP